jgi:hypothetical protein
MQRRDPQGIKIRVALTDGERALQILVEGTLGVTLILDLLHQTRTFRGQAQDAVRRCGLPTPQSRAHAL